MFMASAMPWSIWSTEWIDAFLARHGIAKGHMTLVEVDFLDRLEEDLSERPHERMSGGSAANTIMAVQGLRRPRPVFLQGGERRRGPALSRRLGQRREWHQPQRGGHPTA